MDPDQSSAATDALTRASGQRHEMPGPSVKLALVVVLMAVGIVVLGLIAQVFTGSNPPVATPSSVATAKGSPLKAISASSALAPLVSSGEPPNDIVNAIVLPAGSVPGAVMDNTISAESYDEQRLFSIDASQQSVITFFKVELAAQGWHVESTGAAKNEPGKIEVLAQRAGSDGYYWEIGAVVSQTTFPLSGAARAKGLTNFEVRLFQVSDSD